MAFTLQQYRDRVEAGHILARQLAPYAGRVDTLVLAMPRGGVPIAVEVASYLNAPMDAILVRKLTLPGDPNRSLGALASGGVTVLDDEVITEAGLSREKIVALTTHEAAELGRYEQLYRGRRPPPMISGRVVIVVSEGLDTALSMHAVVMTLLRQEPAWLVIAAPVGAEEVCAELAQEVHEIVCPLRPEPLQSIGLWYDHFAPVDDEEVRASLQHASALPRS